MLSNKYAEYRAKVVNAAINGVSLPDINKLTADALRTCDYPMKTAEINHNVILGMGYTTNDMDSSIIGAVSHALRYMEKHGTVTHVKRCYWMAK